MKLRTYAFALMISLVTLTGCFPARESDREYFESYRASIDDISMTAELRADYGETIADFTLQYSEGDDSRRVDVLEPQLIYGVGVTISKDDSTLEYDGIILSVGELDQDGTTPITVMPALADALRKWHLSDLRIEEHDNTRFLKAELSDMNHTTATFLFNEDMIPVSAELSISGRVAAYCKIISWDMK